MKNSTLSPARIEKKSSDGFSLIELVMALGIFTFSIVGVIGLLPLALQTHMNAKLETIQAQIHQRLAAEVLLTDYSKLQNLNGKLRYFDDGGVEVAEPNNAQRPSIFASKTVVTAALLPAAYSSSSMTKVVFYTIQDPAHRGVSASANPTGSILIAKTAPSS